MRNLITLIFVSFLCIQSVLSQSILAYSHLQEMYFETELPDSLFVVHGERTLSSNNFYVERDFSLAQFDILLTEHPGTCRIFNEFAGQVSHPKRVNLESATEVFFTEDLSGGYDLQNQTEIIHLIQYQVFSKLKTVELFKTKSIKLIFLDEYGDVITFKQYYDNKFCLHLMAQYFFKS
jgi:hypothetical protein